MNKKDIVDKILENKNATPVKDVGVAFAPSNIALSKYWGKRDSEIMLPITSSFSVSLGDLGSETKISLANDSDEIYLNGEKVALDDKFSKRILNFADLIRPDNMKFKIETYNNIPTGAGVASSASGGAALVLAFDDFFGWELSGREKSILARLVSGSASRSIYNNSFVLWEKGEREDGMDCYAHPIDLKWEDLRIGLLLLQKGEKPVSSRAGMEGAETSPLYKDWIARTERDIKALIKAIEEKDFESFGRISEKNAIAMHKIMQSQEEPVNYFVSETKEVMEKVAKLREEGYQVYFTIDGGPNVKLLYLKESSDFVKEQFPSVQEVVLFGRDNGGIER